MNHLLQRFIETLSDPDATLTPQEVDDLSRLYPYLAVAASRLLADSQVRLTPRQRHHYLQSASLNMADGEHLFRLADPDGKALADFYPDNQTKPAPTTDSAIDTFLEAYGTIDPAEQALLERLIFHPVPDYSSLLAKEEAEDPHARPVTDSQDEKLDAFLRKCTPPAPIPEPEPAVAVPPSRPAPVAQPHTSSLSESLAKIYIKQHRYDKAFEIIRNLSLNFPEKSIYFADQLRFLQKLILNSKFKD